MSIAILGDFYIPPSSLLLRDGIQSETYKKNFLKAFDGFEYVTCNFEGVVVDEHSESCKLGPKLGLSSSSLTFLASLNISSINLSNNHFGDYSKGDCHNTIRLAEKNGLDYYGLYNNHELITSEYIGANYKVKFISQADLEYGVSNSHEFGAAGVNVGISFREIQKAKKDGFYVVFLLHDGLEYSKVPTVGLEETCHLLCDFGADLVICQHSHVVGCHEEYNGSSIYYGQGNFLFDYNNRSSEDWKLGSYISVDFKDAKSPIVSRQFFVQDGVSIRLLDNQEASAISENLANLFSQYQSDRYEYWREVFNRLDNKYYNLVFGYQGFLGKIDRKLGLSKRLFRNSKKKYYVANIIRSRTHREIINYLLNGKI